MRKLILGLAITLDGYIEGPNGEFDWCFTDQDYGLNEFFTEIDAIFIGRKSYEVAQQFAESSSGEAILSMPPLTEYVFSTTLKSVKTGAVLISKDAMAEARKIKEQPGKDIWLYGGAFLTEALMNEGLVDELWLSVHPILLGGGRRLFGQSNDRIQLTLLNSKTYATGLVSLRYSIKKDGN
ncbi:dihydrofolate reductase family protein [Dyadobacter sp. LHD-138]|uniref:dihydrofolate reductase family protein n=1 Tax=Dyadobacter sp. LHD-138 TaxID=3071413 RepID=UPI0027DFBC40|nr:dihydrofolate reductase family protein [Dyadobacter sp. LHD-138]MDQ6477081.1 dihydrofolate reductase family protein [Dyadobacter sp. LHD-138]